MAAAQEWNNLATSRKDLRVTKPYGEQRSTYFLQLPYIWAVPLIAMSGVLHWLMSQSFFLVRTETYTEGVASTQYGCGFSFLSLWVFTLAAFSITCAVGLIGNRKMQQRMPFAASCSLVISAACHALEGDEDAQLKKVRWGMVEKSPGTGYKHCSVTTKDTRKPTVGQRFPSPGLAILRCAMLDYNTERQQQ